MVCPLLGIPISRPALRRGSQPHVSASNLRDSSASTRMPGNTSTRSLSRNRTPAGWTLSLDRQLNRREWSAALGRRERRSGRQRSRPLPTPTRLRRTCRVYSHHFAHVRSTKMAESRQDHGKDAAPTQVPAIALTTVVLPFFLRFQIVGAPTSTGRVSSLPTFAMLDRKNWNPRSRAEMPLP